MIAGGAAARQAGAAPGSPAREGDAALAVTGLRVEFATRAGIRVAVHDVSLSVAPGEVLGLVGESGAGKSLTGAALIGLVDPPGRIAAGTLHVGGRSFALADVAQVRKLRGRVIGAVFQDPLTALDPLYTVGAQLVETLRTHRALDNAAARREALALLDDVGIAAARQRFDQFPHQFSGGMRQRIVLALALAGEPRVIIADEPTTALDVSVQAQIIALFRRLADTRGTAFVLVTHDMGVIAETADRVAVMYAGRIVEEGAVAAVLDHPAHPYSAGLMGAIPSLTERRDRLVQIDGSMPSPDVLPSGCAFHPRCPRMTERCVRERPPPGSGRGAAACWHAMPA